MTSKYVRSGREINPIKNVTFCVQKGDGSSAEDGYRKVAGGVVTSRERTELRVVAMFPPEKTQVFQPPVWCCRS